MSAKKTTYSYHPKTIDGIQPEGPYEFPDEVEDDIMGGQRFIKLDDGRLRFHNVDPSLPVSDGIQLPLRPSDEDTAARRKIPFRAKLVDQPIAVGKITNMFVDGEEVFHEMNEKLQAISSTIIKLPAVVLVVGSIGAGKTSLLVTLLNTLTQEGGFKKVVIGSASLGQDAMLMSWLRSRTVADKLRVEVQLKDRLLASDLQEQGEKVRRYHKKFMDLAMRGRMKTTDEVYQEDLARITYPYDPVWHPHTDGSGTHHGHTPKLFDYSLFRKPPAAWSAPGCLSYGQPLRRIPMFEQPEKISEESDYLPSTPSLGETLEETVFRSVNNAGNYQTSLEQILQNEAAAKKRDDQHRPEAVLYVFEDGAYSVDERAMLRELATIRHKWSSAIWLSQGFKAIPKFARTIATDVILFGSSNAQEEKDLEETFSQRVPLFKEKMFACTQPIPGGPDRGFMYIKIRDHDKVFRNFEAELEPIDVDKIREDMTANAPPKADSVPSRKPRSTKNKSAAPMEPSADLLKRTKK